MESVAFNDFEMLLSVQFIYRTEKLIEQHCNHTGNLILHLRMKFPR